jgi:phage gp29-like protein
MASLFSKAVGRARGAYDALRGRAPEGRTYEWSRQLDSHRESYTPRLTFARLGQILRSGHDGNLVEALLLFEEMAARDPRLMSNVRKRRMALTGLEFEIRSAAEDNPDVDKALADEAAAYVREKFDELEMDCVLEHLARAIGPNLAVMETEWQRGEPIALIPIPSSRITMDLAKSPDLRIVTEGDRMGLVMAPPKFVLHIPHAVSGSPLFESLSAAQATIWLIKHLALKNWATFCEIFGMPIRVGKYDTGTREDEKAVLRDMLTNIGSNAWAMISRATDIEFTESTQRGAAPFEAIIRYLDKEQDILWCGGNLTGDTTGGTGTYAAASVQDSVRDDLRDDDIRRESRTVRTQVIRAWCAFKYPGREVPLPICRRIKPETVDRTQEATFFKTAQSAGIAIPKAWGYQRLSIPQPQDGEEVLEPVDAFVQGMREEQGEEDELETQGSQAARQRGNKPGEDEDDEDQ